MRILFVVLLIAILVLFFIIRKKKTPAKKIVHGKYHCVTVAYPKNACNAVKRLKDQRILSSEAPVLPLAECDKNECNCRFHHHEERRVEERRDAYHKAIDDISEATVTMTPRSDKDRRKS